MSASGKAPSKAGTLDNTLWPVAIGVAARLSKVSAKMVRHYESVGLLAAVARTDSGYRQYTEANARTLQFIKRARDLGFSMAEIAELVGLWHNRKRASASVKRIAQKHVDELAHRIEAMQAMQRTLASLLNHCHGDERPDCPILDDLAGNCCQTSDGLDRMFGESPSTPQRTMPANSIDGHILLPAHPV